MLVLSPPSSNRDIAKLTNFTSRHTNTQTHTDTHRHTQVCKKRRGKCISHSQGAAKMNWKPIYNHNQRAKTVRPIRTGSLSMSRIVNITYLARALFSVQVAHSPPENIGTFHRDFSPGTMHYWLNQITLMEGKLDEIQWIWMTRELYTTCFIYQQ